MTSAADKRWAEGLARKVLQARLPHLRRSWEWDVAERAVGPLLREARNLRVPQRVRNRIEYDLEEAMRTALADPRGLAAVQRQLAQLATADLGRGVPRKKTETAIARASKSVVDTWIATRVAIGLERGRKELARGERETRALFSRIEQMDARRLHGFANRYNWDDGVFAVAAVARHPKCALGTALLVYWLARPYWYAQWRTATAADDPETFSMLASIEARIAKNGYAHAGVAFDPRKEGLTAATYDDEPKKRALPPQVFRATTAREIVRFEPPPP